MSADLNAEDDEGPDWSTLSEAGDPARICSGVMLIAGNRHAQAVVRLVAVEQDRQVHSPLLPRALEKSRHLIGRALA